MLELRDVTRAAGREPVLSRASLVLSREAPTAIVGLTAYERDMLLRLLGGEEKPQSGSIKLDGKSPEYVVGLLDALVLARAEHSAAAPRAGSLRLDGKPTDEDPAEEARKEMLNRFANAHKGGK